jgi:hypothetical protein
MLRLLVSSSQVKYNDIFCMISIVNLTLIFQVPYKTDASSLDQEDQSRQRKAHTLSHYQCRNRRHVNETWEGFCLKSNRVYWELLQLLSSPFIIYAYICYVCGI